MTTQPLRGFYYSFMNQKKRKDEEQIQDERYEILKHIFIKEYFQFAQRINYGKYMVSLGPLL